MDDMRAASHRNPADDGTLRQCAPRLPQRERTKKGPRHDA
ncbi:hypothetical protein PT2222_380021 [Paraburkholderia tropica]